MNVPHPQRCEKFIVNIISGNEKFLELRCLDEQNNPARFILPVSFQCLSPEENGCEALAPVDIELGGTITLQRASHSNAQSERDKVLVILDGMIAHFEGFKDQHSFRYSALDIVEYLGNFKKLTELRSKAGEK